MSERRLSWSRWLADIAHAVSILVGIFTLPIVLVAAYDVVFGDTLLEEAIGVEPGNQGNCAVGMVVEVDEFCVFKPTEGRFRVVGSGANPPGEARLATDRVKIDWDSSGHAFQATRLPDGDGAWRIDVAGLWRNAGSLDDFCHTGDTLEPGEFCTERNTNRQFRVYATDELDANDKAIRAMCPTGDGDKCRALHANGYGVLYQFGPNSEPILERIPNGYNGRLDGRRIRCVDSTDGTMVLFEAERQAEAGEEAPGDMWRIVTTTQIVTTQGDQGLLDCTPENERAES